MGSGTTIKIVNSKNVNNHEIAKLLDLQNTKQIKAVTYIFTQHLKNATIHIIGPLPNGTSVLRITAKPLSGEKILKAHVEINLTGDELNKFLLKQEFYDALAITKLNQFTGYMGEQILMNYARNGILHNKAYMKTLGKIKAKTFHEATGKTIKSNRVWAIQNRSGHGIDFLAEVEPFPPEPKYITIDAKSTLRGKYGDYATPRGPSLSDKQESPVDNLLYHLRKAIRKYATDNPYNLSKKEFYDFEQLINYISLNRKLVDGYVANIGLTKGFNVAKNSKNGELIVLEKIKEKT